MGLDMYLVKEIYVKNYSKTETSEDGQPKGYSIDVKLDGKEIPKDEIDLDEIKSISFEVGYWRKANQIHNWFVNNCAGGDHDKTRMWVSEEQLKELLEICKKVKDVAITSKGQIANGKRFGEGGWVDMLEDGIIITNPEEVEKILPTQSGFFFGSTGYDQYYLADIDNTIKILENINFESVGLYDYFYEASW